MNASVQATTLEQSDPILDEEALDHPPEKEAGVIETEGREKFIPVTRFAILDRVSRRDVWREGEHEHALTFLRYLGAWRHQEYCGRLLRLKEAYFPFSPDRDTVEILKYSDSERSVFQNRLTATLGKLLEQANYTQITKEDIDSYFEAQSPYGLNLKVDLSEFEEVMIYCRGSDTVERFHRSWTSLYLKKETLHVPIFQRLFLLLKLKSEDIRIQEIMAEHAVNERKARSKLRALRKNLPDHASSDHVYLKMFKSIPQSDLEMLFPNTTVNFKLLDKIKLGATAGSGTVMSIASTIGKISAAAANPIALAGVLFGLVAVIFRQVMKFFNQRTQYMMVLAQNLYFHNLANNRGVLTLLVDRAEEEDIKEEMLLYAYLSQYSVPRRKLSQAKQAIETYLQEEFNIGVDYDIEDALQRLTRDGFVVETPKGNLMSVRPKEAVAKIEGMWGGCLTDGFPAAANAGESEIQI